MSKISLSPSALGTGTLTISAPNTNTDRAIALPDAAGTVFVSGQALSATTGSFSGTVSGGSTIGVGGATPSASGAGITFPATQSASSDANTLDDYEEGTWTPTVRGGSTAGTTTYTSFREGSYVKIGRQVTANCRVGYSAATGTGYMTIGGLPFQAINQSFTGTVMVDRFNWPVSGSFVAYVANSTDLTFWVSGDDAAWDIASISNEAADFIVNITYFV